MVAKVQLSFEIKREGFPKVEGKIPISDLGYLFHFSFTFAPGNKFKRIG